MKHYNRILAILLMLAMLVSVLSFPVAAAEEEEQDSLCKVLVWTDGNGEHAVPYTDLSGWDRVWADSIGTNEYLLYNAGFGTYREYFSAGFASRYLASEPEGSVGLALVKIGDVVNGTTPNTYEMKIDATINFSWKAGIAGTSTFYPVKGVIFYDPNSTSDEPVEASINPSALSSRWYGEYPPACHLSGAHGAALAEALAKVSSV